MTTLAVSLAYPVWSESRALIGWLAGAWSRDRPRMLSMENGVRRVVVINSCCCCCWLETETEPDVNACPMSLWLSSFIARHR